MGGKLVFPGGGAYHATKYAVEALSDAMRFEVKGFGIDVVMHRAGPDHDRVRRHGGRVGRRHGDKDSGPYDEVQRGGRERDREAYEGPMAKLGGGPEKPWRRRSRRR